jgi:hypothetical protein
LWLLRAEGAAALAAAVWAYGQTGQGWWLFALLILVPDITMLGYLHGARLGATVYNLGHTYLAPLALLAVGWAAALPLVVGVALIWVAHIGMDRAVGYGLKYAHGFKATHLGAG